MTQSLNWGLGYDQVTGFFSVVFPSSPSDEISFKMNSQGSLEKKKEHPRKSIKGEIWGKEERGSFGNTLKRLVLAICNYELFWGAGRAPLPLPFIFSKQEPLLGLALLIFISLSQGPQETKP